MEKGGRKWGGKSGKHPWTKWFNKGAFVAKKGRHFDNEPHVFAQMVRNCARDNYGLKVTVSVVDKKSVVVRVVGVVEGWERPAHMEVRLSKMRRSRRRRLEKQRRKVEGGDGVQVHDGG